MAKRKTCYEHGGRYFAAGVRADSELHYYVNPEVSELVLDLIRGKYCLLTGHRQSGKSTSIRSALEQAVAVLDEKSPRGKKGFTAVVLSRGISETKPDWCENFMWTRLCRLLHSASPDLFTSLAERRDYDCDDLADAFRVRSLKAPVLLVIDEADTLLRLNPSCIDALLHTVRGIKSEQAAYNLWTMVLVGTDQLKDLIEMRYHVAAGYEPSLTSPSPYSPFPHDHLLSAARFRLEDVAALLSQYAADFPLRGVDVEGISNSIFELTNGHKGLTGTCLAFMDQNETFSLEQWNRSAASGELLRHVFSLATYSRVMEAVRKEKRLQERLKPFVEHASVRYDPDFDDISAGLRAYFATGVLVIERDTEQQQVYAKLSSPLLRMAILSRLAVAGNLNLNPLETTLENEEGRRWVLETVFQYLDGGILKSPEVLLNNGKPSEYSYQFAFLARLKLVLETSFPVMRLKVLPEVREVKVAGQQRSLLRADALVTNGPQFQRFAFEFLVLGTPGETGSLKKHYDKALVYAQQHSALVYLVNISAGKRFAELVPGSASVVFVGVEFMDDSDSALVKFIYSTNTTYTKTISLKRWDGEIDYLWDEI